VYLLLITALVAGPQANLRIPFPASSDLQLGCVEQAVGNAKILASRSLDVDQDGKLDQVVLYGGDNLHILVALSQSSTTCKVVVNEYLTALALVHPPELRTVKVREIEMIELTGDHRPELYVWLEKSGGGPRFSYAIHTIYTNVDGRWQEALDVELCLSFNAFELRDSSTAGTKDIYLESDPQCKPPWSSHRAYSVMKWNGSEFVLSESGTIDTLTTNPPWLNAFCVSTVVCPAVVLVLVTALLINRRLSGEPKGQARKS
jgi:hypothetical protein